MKNDMEPYLERCVSGVDVSVAHKEYSSVLVVGTRRGLSYVLKRSVCPADFDAVVKNLVREVVDKFKTTPSKLLGF